MIDIKKIAVNKTLYLAAGNFTVGKTQGGKALRMEGHGGFILG